MQFLIGLFTGFMFGSSTCRKRESRLVSKEGWDNDCIYCSSYGGIDNDFVCPYHPINKNTETLLINGDKHYEIPNY